MDASLERRVEILEENMEQLRDVPARLSAVESQIVQLRGDMQTEFSALRDEMRAGDESLRVEMRTCEERLRTEIA